MPSGIIDVSKQWLFLKKRVGSLKRFGSQPDLKKYKENQGPSPEKCMPTKALKVLVEFADNKGPHTAETSPISAIRFNTSMNGRESQVETPVRPPLLEIPPTTEEEFQRVIFEAQQYKDACAAAEDAAEEESRRRFKHYQDMYYVEKALQEKSAQAFKDLNKILASAREAGFPQLALQTSTCEGGEESSLSHDHDTINRFIDRLDNDFSPTSNFPGHNQYFTL